jgi:hypothetical protein
LETAAAMLKQFRWSFTPSRLRCVFLGHDDSFAREPYRLFLRCDVCGRETRGWTVGRPPGARVRPALPAMARLRPLRA